VETATLQSGACPSRDDDDDDDDISLFPFSLPFPEI